jgi:hypothetical protein
MIEPAEFGRFLFSSPAHVQTSLKGDPLAAKLAVIGS